MSPSRYYVLAFAHLCGLTWLPSFMYIVCMWSVLAFTYRLISCSHNVFCLSFCFKASQHMPSALVLPPTPLHSPAASFKSPHRHVVFYTSLASTFSLYHSGLPLRCPTQQVW